MKPPSNRPANWKGNRVTMAVDDPNRKRGPTLRTGNAPDQKQEPLLLSNIYVGGEAWHLSLLRSRMDGATANDDPCWHNLKLHVQGKALHKGNYWISWNTLQHRLNARLDTRALNTLRTDLALAVTVLLTYMDQRGEWQMIPNQPLYVVRPDGNSYSVTEELSEQDKAIECTRLAAAALTPLLEAMPVGGTLLTLAPLDIIKLAISECVPAARFSGAVSPLGGHDVTKIGLK